MIWKMSPLVKFVILVVFVNIGTADDKYPVRDCENLPFTIQGQLSLKRKSFSQFFVPFQEFSANFKHFQRKEGRHS